MRDIGHNVIARNKGTVIYINSKRIVVYEPKDQKQRAYLIPQSDKSNQEMCKRIRVVVNSKQSNKTK